MRLQFDRKVMALFGLTGLAMTALAGAMVSTPESVSA
jgi:hypothetical protein